MTDDMMGEAPRDPARVYLGEADEVVYWTARFGCSEEELRRAVQCTGINAIAVGAYFARKGRPPFAREYG